VKAEDALAACEATVRRHDPDRYFSALFAPADRRRFLFVLYAFNYEVARIGERSREPMMGAIRLEWWRETVMQARDGRPRTHPVAIGLAEVLSEHALPEELFEALLDAREFDIAADSFADVGELERYCDATSSGLMRIAASVLNSDSNGDTYLKHAGSAYAITGLLRAIPFHAVRGKLYLPRDLFEAEGLTPGDVIAGRCDGSLKRVVLELSSVARRHIQSARAAVHDRPEGIAALPAALAPLYLNQIGKSGFNPLRSSSDVPLFRRQLVLLRGAMTGRI
jgi:phytoene synthase